MCGIVGTLSFGELQDNKLEKIRQEAMIFLSTELLQLTQSRGKDATGVATLFSDGNFFGLKMGIPSPDFIARFGEKETDYDGFLKVWRDNFIKRKKTVKTFLGHCRKTSIGHANDNMNNHPVRVGEIIGVHNGTLTNHDEIFKMLKCERDGDVDSEAIVRLVHYLTKEGKDPFSLDVLKETCMRLHGTYSCIVLNGDSPNQVATFRDGRPAEAAIIRSLGIVLIASDTDFLKAALFRYQKMSKLYPTSINFPMLSKADIDVKILPDDHAYVWDLSVQMNKKTEIADLYVSERIPRTGKLWGKSAVSSYNRYPNQNQSWADKNKAKRTEVDATPATGNKDETGDDDDSSAKENKSSARVWNKALGAYESKEGIEDTKKIGAVEIDAGPAGAVTTLSGEDVEEKLKKDEQEKKKSDVLTLKVVDEDEINSLIGDPIKIMTIPFPTELKPVAEGDCSFDDVNLKTTEVKQLDFKVDSESLKKASEVSANLEKFEDDDEVVAALGANPETLKKAPLYALANRIVKQVFEEAYALGHSTGKTEGKEKKKAIPVSVKKIVKRDKLFIALKELVAVLASAVLDTNKSSFTIKKELIDRALIEKLNKGEARNLSTDAMMTIFSAGDYAKNPAIRQLKLSIMSIKEKYKG